MLSVSKCVGHFTLDKTIVEYYKIYGLVSTPCVIIYDNIIV